MYLIDGVEGKQSLQPIYKELNQKYFGNALPNIKTRWDGRLKRAIGRASVKYRSVIGSSQEIDTNSLVISMSKAFDLNYNDLQAVMLHEMAHIKLYTENKLGHHHRTSYFQSLIKRLRKESGINVPMKESSFKTSPTSTATEGYIALFKTSGGTGISVYSDPFMKKNWKELGSFYANFLPSGKIRGAELWQVKHPIIKNSTKKRSLKRISWKVLPNDEIENIKKSGFKFGEFGPSKKWLDASKTRLPGGRKIQY